MAETLQQIIQRKLQGGQASTGAKSFQQIVKDKLAGTMPVQPVVNYRQGVVPYSSLPANTPAQITANRQQQIDATQQQAQTLTGRVGSYVAPQTTGPVRNIDIVREMPGAMLQTFSYPVKKLLDFAGKSSAHALNILASPVETIAAKLGKDPTLITTKDMLNDTAERWSTRADKIGNVFTAGGQGLQAFDEYAWNKLAEPLAKGVVDKNKSILDRTMDLATLIDVGVMRVFADPLWLGAGKIQVKTKALTLGEQGIAEQNALATLGLRQGATAEEINAAFRAKSHQLHPDTLFGRTNPGEAELLNAQREFSNIVAARNTLIAKFKKPVKPTTTVERTQSETKVTPTTPAEITTPAIAGRITEPTRPTMASNVAFQIPNAINSRNIISGPVTTQVQQKINQIVTPDVTTSPSRTTAVAPIIRPATTEQSSKFTKVEILNELAKIKDLLTAEIYNKAQALIAKNIAPTYNVNKNHKITGVVDSGNTIKGEVKIQVKEPKTGEIKAVKTPQVVSKGTSIQPVKAKIEKPITVREQAEIKREERLVKAAEEKNLAKIVEAEKAKNAATKSYKERLAQVTAKKEAVKKVEAKPKSIKEYLLEKEIVKREKAGTITKEEAAKARATGKFNTVTKEIDYNKQSPEEFENSVFNAEKAEHVDSVEFRNSQYKLREFGFRVIKKYMRKLDKMGVVSEKYLPRGVAGSVDQYFTTRLKSLNKTSDVTHEATHIIDRGLDWRNTVKDEKVIANLTDIYLKYYPNAKKNPETMLAIKEGLATFVEHYAFQPTKIAAEYPLLVKEILGENGLYYDPLFSELIDDVKGMQKEFQGLDELAQTGALVADDPIKFDLPSFYSNIDAAKMHLVHDKWLLERFSKDAKIDRTVADPYPYTARYGLVANVINHNIMPKGHFKTENYLVLKNEQGDYLPAQDFNIATIQKKLKTANNSKDFGYYRLDRDTDLNYQEVDDFKVMIKTNNEKIKERQAEFESTQSEAVQKEIKALQQANAELKEYLDRKIKMLKERGIPREVAHNAYIKNKERFKEADEMLDKIFKTRLDTYLLTRLIKPELYDILVKRKGYAPGSVEILDEMGGTNEISEFLHEENRVLGGTKIKNLQAREGTTKAVINPWKQVFVSENSFQKLTARAFINNKLGEVAHKFPTGAIKRVPYVPGMELQKDIIVWTDSNYKKQALQLHPDFKQVFDITFNPKRAGALNKLLLIAPAKLFTSLTTSAYAAFSVANYPLDAVGSFFTTKNNLVPIITPLKQTINTLLKDSATREYAKEYLNIVRFSQSQLGSIYEASMDEAVNLIQTGFRNKLYKYTEGALDKTSSVLGFLGQASELLTRMPEYIKSRQNGNSQAIATEDAATVSGAFGHHGIQYNYIRSAVYLNPTLQIADLTVQTYGRMIKQAKGAKSNNDKTNVIGRFAATQILLITVKLMGVATLLYALTNAETDEEKEKAAKDLSDYNNRTEYERLNFMRDPFTRKFGLRVPTNWAAIPNLAEMIAADEFLNTNFSKGDYAKYFVESQPVPLNPFSMIPYVSNLLFISLGIKTFPTIDFSEPAYMANMKPSERFTRSTTPLANYLGSSKTVAALNAALPNKMQISPIKIDEYIKWVGRAGYKQFFGAYDPKNNMAENVVNSFLQTFKDAFYQKTYIFNGREFDKFYDDAQKLGWEVKEQKDLLKVVQDTTLIPALLSSASKSKIYSSTSDIISMLKDIDMAKIEVPLPYQNAINATVMALNRDDVEKAKKELMKLVNGEFINFVNNATRLIENEKNTKIKEDYNKNKPSVFNTLFGVKIASAAENDTSYPKRRNPLPGETEYKITGNEIKKIVTYSNLTDASGKVLYTFSNEDKTIDRATIYHPMNARETKPNPNGIGSAGIKLKFGDVAISKRDVNSAVIQAARDGKFLYIYVKELNKIKTPYGNGIFRVLDTKNERYKDKREIDFVSDDIYGTKSYPYTKIERELVKAKTLQYFVK